MLKLLYYYPLSPSISCCHLMLPQPLMPQPPTLNQLRFTGHSLSRWPGVSPLLHCHISFLYILLYIPQTMWRWTGYCTYQEWCDILHIKCILCLVFNPSLTLYYHHPSIHCLSLSCPLTHWLLCKVSLGSFFPCFALFVCLPFPSSDHFAITVASSGFYATALYITDCMLFAVLQKIDLTVVPTT